MAEKTPRKLQFNWRMPLYAAAGACIVYLPITVYGSDMGDFLYIFLVVPIISLVLSVALLLTFAMRRKSRQLLSGFAILAAYVAVTGALFMNYAQLRPSLRWLLWSNRYKAELLAVPDSANSGLKHIEWDSWGFAGNDTIEYLVFDPTDALFAAVKRHSSGKFHGIPCEVSRVRRLESRWYSVEFYTDTGWGDCGYVPQVKE